MLNMKALPSRLWQSPTFMTWGSFLSRTLSLVIVLPLLLTRLDTSEIALWYLFATIIGLQSVIDMGFSPTFTRVIAYVMGGAELHELKAPGQKSSGSMNRGTLNQVFTTMRRIYSRLGLFWMLLLATAGTLALKRPIAATRGDTAALWLAWAIIVAGSWISLHGNMYSSYLQGVNQIALLRRWETLISLGVMATSFLILVAGGGLLGLVFANQGWQIVCILGNRWLARNAENGLLRSFVKAPFARDVFAAVWPSAWRSGIGILMSYGLIQVSGIVYAQIGETAKVAMYLLGLRLIQTVSQFSQAPFYSKLPLLARLFSAGRLDELLRMAKRGMTFSHWIFTAGFIGLGVAGAPLCRHIGSNAAFPDQLLWSLMGLGFFIERYGAMHIQLYSTTNRIIWHIANGVMGILFILISLALFPPLGIYAFPVGIIAGYLGFYSWFAALHSYRTFKMNFLAFEMRTSILPLLTIVLYIALSGLASRLFGLAF